MFLIIIAAIVGAAVTVVIGTAVCCLPMGVLLSPFGGSLVALAGSLVIWP